MTLVRTQELLDATVNARVGAQAAAAPAILQVSQNAVKFLHVKKPPSQSLTGFVFQAGHASSILVTRSTAKALVRGHLLPCCHAPASEQSNSGHYLGH